MKMTTFVIASVMAAMTVPALADDKMADGKKMEYYKRHHRTMEILKETMAIVAGLNHMPSAEDKKKLEGMMKELDEMMKMDMHPGGTHHGDGHGHQHDKK